MEETTLNSFYEASIKLDSKTKDIMRKENYSTAPLININIKSLIKYYQIKSTDKNDIHDDCVRFILKMQDYLIY